MLPAILFWQNVASIHVMEITQYPLRITVGLSILVRIGEINLEPLMVGPDCEEGVLREICHSALFHFDQLPASRYQC